MRDFTFQVEDERYSVPTMLLVGAIDEERARELALEKLTERHHVAVEVYEDDKLLFRIER